MPVLYSLFSSRPQYKKHKWSNGRGIELVILLSKMSLKHFTDLSKISKVPLNSAQPGHSPSLTYKRLEVVPSDRFWLGVQVYLRSTVKHHPEIPRASSLLTPRMPGGQAYISQQESRTFSLEKLSLSLPPSLSLSLHRCWHIGIPPPATKPPEKELRSSPGHLH